MKKKILYLDLDGVVADFDKAIKTLCPDIDISPEYSDAKSRSAKVDELCNRNPDIFHDLDPVEGAIDAVNQLFGLFDVYFLSTAMWKVPGSFTGKRVWVEKHFGDKSIKRLILTHRKDLNLGDYLVDDRTKNGAGEFQGFHIHFRTEKFPDWTATLNFLTTVA